jgi:hypothetical protein
MKTLLATLALSVALIAPASLQAQLMSCRPANNCSAADKPCWTGISGVGGIKDITPHPVAGTPVIRVRLCRGASDVCGGGTAVQALSVFGYDKDLKQIYSKTLSTGEGYDDDTGQYTEVKGLTKLRVRCNANTCQLAWQVCRKSLPETNK